MRADALLQDRDRFPNFPLRLKKPQQQHGVAEIAEVDRRFHDADHAMLGHDQDRQNALLVQVGEQLVYLEREKAFLRHRLQIAVEAVDDDDGGVSLDDASTDERSELAGRHLCRIDLMQYDIAGLE